MTRVLILSNPRSGSSLLQDLLNCHGEVEIVEELLNDEFGVIQNPLAKVQSSLDELHKTIIGFKVFPEQIYRSNLKLSELLVTTAASHVIVLWREDMLSTYCSLCIASLSGEWYTLERSNTTKQICVNEKDFREYVVVTKSDWKRIGEEWPEGVRPIYVKFEDLVRQPIEEVKRVLAELSCNSEHAFFKNTSERQNPAPIHEKVTNYEELCPDLRAERLDVKTILQKSIKNSPPYMCHWNMSNNELIPDEEPNMPAVGWKYSVAKPYLPALAMQNVFDAMQSGSISSAGYWPKQLAARLRSLFHYPVAQPCCNGFTALMLALQAANIGEGDEVIIPTMTMVAVPNAISYVRGTPVFADNAKECYNPMWADYEKQATPKTKALIVTHTYGVPGSDIEDIEMKCKARGWILIEDISECVGVMCTTSDGNQRLLGTFGDFSCSSLYANKIVHGGDGGFVIAKDANIGKRLASIVNHGFTPRFHFVHFERSINAKIHGIGAAIASGCFDELDVIMRHRSQLAAWYRRNLRELQLKLMPRCGADDTPWVFGIECKSKSERTALRKFMAEHGIETRDFFFNLHLQPVSLSDNERSSPPSLPNAEHLGSTGFYLPTHSNLTEEDVQYICDCVKLYFASGTSQQDFNSPLISTKNPSKACVQVEPNGFSLFVRQYRDTGDITNVHTRAHVYINAVRLGIEAENVLQHETFDSVTLLLKNIKRCLAAADGYPLQNEMTNFFLPYVKYYECQRLLEQPLKRPWLSVDLNSSHQHHTSKRIPTTTDKETLQLLVWIIHQQKPETIWEIGSWMGHATVLMAEVCSHLKIDCKIYACDAFRYQSWMNEYFPKNTKYVNDSRSFLEVFQANAKPFSRYIQSIVWPYEISELPTELKSRRPQLIFLDSTQKDSDLEHIWSLIETALIPNETIVLFNGLTKSSIPFFTRHSDQLIPLLKPHSIAKAFRYISTTMGIIPSTYEDVERMMNETVPMKRNLKFYKTPAWDHQHNNLFCKSIELLKRHLHSDEENIIFFPAVEDALCEDIDLFYENAWVGIIHGLEYYPELFYTPDLKRLCTNRRYIEALKNCKGLFTLTSFQADYLRKNLPDGLHKFPIQKIHYPIDIHTAYGGGSCLPQLIANDESLDVIHIGNYARDFQFFFNLSLPSKYRKILLIGDEDGETFSRNIPSDVTVLRRLSGDEYEAKLRSSVVLLTLKYGGAANTLLLECIARNIPILCPNMSSCTDYVGSEYPLLYDSSKPNEMESLLSPQNIIDAISYLECMDKASLSLEKFIKDVKYGAVMLSLPPNPSTTICTSVHDDPLTHLAEGSGRVFKAYDVTICICSYKRTHNLEQLLESLWNAQDFHGSYEIIIWNNNASRVETVMDETKKYIKQSTDVKSMAVINSSENYYCSIRFALPPLLNGNCVLICDDDIIPGSNFISFFHAAHRRHPEDVLCVRGHKFFAHELNLENPKDVWMNYDNLKFKDDNQPEQLIHFVHADACLIPKRALQEIASVCMPDPTFALVDDYWMSFILSHKFGRKLRKLSVSGLVINPIRRTEDSDQPGLALHTRPEVQDARLRLYVHHMLLGWPKWETMSTNIDESKQTFVKNKKETFWNHPTQIGYNIHSEIDQVEISNLVRMGVKCVRIGAVGVREKTHFELSGFLTEPVEQLKQLTNTIKFLQRASIDVIITLQRTLATPEIWRMIAEKLVAFENVVGYDLMNEPFTEYEDNLHWADLQLSTVDTDLNAFIYDMTEIIHSIRQVDQFTTIVLEPTFWASVCGLPKFPIEEFLKIDGNLAISVHFYDPMTLTFRSRNKGRYSFPSSVPWYQDIPYSEETYWDKATVSEQLQKAKMWATEKGVRMFVGEFGICREIEGAVGYLTAVIDSCRQLNMTGLLFSYRDPNWDAMDYEFGTNPSNFHRLKTGSINGQDNPFNKIIFEGIVAKE